MTRHFRSAGVALAALLALASCAERRKNGEQCVFNDDCENPLVCAAARCRVQCRTDRDCPSGQLCAPSENPSKRVCLAPGEGALCAADRQCPQGASCLSNVCWWACAEDIACVPHNAGTCLQPERLCSVPATVLTQREASASLPDGGDTDASTLDASMPDVPSVTDVPAVMDLPSVTDVPAVTDVPSVTDMPPADPCQVDPDVDDDSYRAVECGGNDCDDRRRDVSPIAVERCDGVDNDCDRMVDEGASAQCAVLNAMSSVCRAGACAPVACIAGWGDCDGDGANGCETDTRAASAHCGACGNACPAGANAMSSSCRSGACAVGACLAGWGDCDGAAMNGCETELRDPRNCGRCGEVCPTRAHAAPTCRDGACGITCETGYADCDNDPVNGCEVWLQNDRANCGICRRACAGGADVCVRGSCLPHPFPSTGAEGAFDPMSDTVLAAGVHHFSTVRVRRGVTVRTDGVGVLEIRATGDVTIEGVVDVSGGDGGDGLNSGAPCGGNGGGGSTGDTRSGAVGASSMCRPAGVGGIGGTGANGSVSLPTGCGLGGRFGGGAGGAGTQPGGGGGGTAGGGGGASPNTTGGAGGGVSGSSVGGAGGVNSPGSRRGGAGGEPGTSAPYRGSDGTARCSDTLHGTGGGGGSIGALAIADLAVRTTFSPGSGGGGGAGGATTCAYTAAAGGGGGGGGGALRIASPTRLVVSGTLRAPGGSGGAGSVVGYTNGSQGAGGGGGSGGVIYLAAPSIDVSGSLSAAGGAGGGGGGGCGGLGGAGGMGRIRVSTLPETCSLRGDWEPPLASGCAASTAMGTPGRVFVGTYPD